MKQEVLALIDRATDEALRGAVQPKEAIVRMLELDPESEEVAYLRKCASRVAHEASGGKCSIAGAIGVDLCSCDMNCKFCSFGTAWGLVTEEVKYTKEEIIEMARADWMQRALFDLGRALLPRAFPGCGERFVGAHHAAP